MRRQSCGYRPHCHLGRCPGMTVRDSSAQIPGNSPKRSTRRVGVRSPRPRLSLGVTLPGRYQPRPRLSTRYRLDQPWGSIGGWPRVSMPGTADGGHLMHRNPCGSHGRPPSGPPGTEGTVLISLCAAGRRGLPDGGSTRFHGGSTRWQGHRGGSCRQPREAVAALS